MLQNYCFFCIYASFTCVFAFFSVPLHPISILAHYATFGTLKLSFEAIAEIRNLETFFKLVYKIMINSQDVKNGVCIRMDGRLYFVIDFLHVKPGKGNTIMRVKFKDVVDGRVLERRFNIGEKLEDVRVERRPYQYLYKEGEDYIFMNQETFEQVPIGHDLITGVDFLKEGFVCDVVSDASTDTILFAELPT